MVTKRTDLNVIATIYDQGNQFTALNKDGTTRVLMNHSPCAPVPMVGIELTGLSAYAAFKPLQPCPGLEVRTVCDMDLAGIFVDTRRKELLCEALFDPKRRPEAARELMPCRVATKRLFPLTAATAQHQEAANDAKDLTGQADLKKKAEAPLSNTLAQELAAGKTDKVNVADLRALLNSFIKVEKISLVAAPNESHSMGARSADHVKAKDTYALAIRGSTPANSFFQAAVQCSEMLL